MSIKVNKIANLMDDITWRFVIAEEDGVEDVVYEIVHNSILVHNMKRNGDINDAGFGILVDFIKERGVRALTPKS